MIIINPTGTTLFVVDLGIVNPNNVFILKDQSELTYSWYYSSPINVYFSRYTYSFNMSDLIVNRTYSLDVYSFDIDLFEEYLTDNSINIDDVTIEIINMFMGDKPLYFNELKIQDNNVLINNTNTYTPDTTGIFYNPEI